MPHLFEKGYIIFILSANLSVGQNIDELILISESSFPNEDQNQIIHLPLTKIEY